MAVPTIVQARVSIARWNLKEAVAVIHMDAKPYGYTSGTTRNGSYRLLTSRYMRTFVTSNVGKGLRNPVASRPISSNWDGVRPPWALTVM